MKVISNPNSNPISAAERDKRVANSGFGKYYTDNMVVALGVRQLVGMMQNYNHMAQSL